MVAILKIKPDDQRGSKADIEHFCADNGTSAMFLDDEQWRLIKMSIKLAKRKLYAT